VRRPSLVAAVTLVVAALVLAGCSDDSDGSSSPSTTKATTGAPATTAPAASATKCAQLLFAAWRAGSEADAPACAPPEQVQALFAQPYVGPYVGPACEPLDGIQYCTWIGPDGLVIQVQDSPPYTVTSVARRAA
jgi:hypothetical protein